MGLPRAFLDTARALVRADTSPGHGTRAAAELLAPLYEAAGLPVRRQEDEAGEVNLLAGPGGSGSPAADPSRASAAGGTLLVTHVDTVPGGPVERWTETSGDPWGLTEKNGLLFGLGTADGIAIAAAMTVAIAFPFWFWRYARSLWLMLDQYFDPRRPPTSSVGCEACSGAGDAPRPPRWWAASVG